MFPGFTAKESFTRIPDSFFQHLLKEITEADELKVTLYALWRFENSEARNAFLLESEFIDFTPDAASGLEKAVRWGSLLRVEKDNKGYYFLNSPRGQAAAAALENRQGDLPAASSGPPPERPNIFKLYEENIGPLTPLMADALKDAEGTYPGEWLEEAIDTAVKNNKRNWKYVEAILLRWKVEGHAKKQDGRDAKKPHGRDVTRKVEDFLKRQR